MNYSRHKNEGAYRGGEGGGLPRDPGFQLRLGRENEKKMVRGGF